MSSIQGLDALLSGVENSGGIIDFPIEKIKLNPTQPRTLGDYGGPAWEAYVLTDAWLRFVESIKKHGIQEPLLLSPPNASGFSTLIRGERRYRAAVLLKLLTVPVRFSKGIEDLQDPVLLFVDNEHREKLHPIDLGDFYVQTMALKGWSQAQLAEEFVVDKSNVSMAVSLSGCHADEKLKLKVERPSVGLRMAYDLLCSKKPSKKTNNKPGDGGNDESKKQAMGKAKRADYDVVRKHVTSLLEQGRAGVPEGKHTAELYEEVLKKLLANI